MIRAIGLALAIGFLATAAACGGGSGNPDRVLQLNSGTFTEDRFRSLIQETIADQEPYEIVCAALGGLTNEQAVEAYERSIFVSNPAGGFIFADEERSVQILREECEAAYQG